MRSFIRQLVPAIVALAVFTVLLGVVYPLLTTGVAQVAFGDQADGSLIERDGTVVGSELIGQPFVSSQYFHPRPSAAGAGYDGAASSGSNLGPLSEDLLAAVEQRVADYRAINGLDAQVPVPVDAVTASGSGPRPAHLGGERPPAGAARGRRPGCRRRDGARHRRSGPPRNRCWACSASGRSTCSTVNLALDEQLGAVG